MSSPLKCGQKDRLTISCVRNFNILIYENKIPASVRIRFALRTKMYKMIVMEDILPNKKTLYNSQFTDIPRNEYNSTLVLNTCKYSTKKNTKPSLSALVSINEGCIGYCILMLISNFFISKYYCEFYIIFFRYLFKLYIFPITRITR